MYKALELMRPRQWLKSGLVFGGAFFSGQLLNVQALVRVLVIFVIFCLISSAVYIFNDLCDIDNDRLHSKKRRRPIADGSISPKKAFVLIIIICGVVSGIIFWADLSRPTITVLGTYVAINIAYSLGIKYVSVIELFCVSSGFVLRFLAGSLAINVPMSSWIISTVAIGSLLVVGAKRRSDIALGNDAARMRQFLGGGYNIAYLDSVVTVLAAGTLIVYLLFCVSDYGESRYGQGVLMTAIPVAVGILRFLQLVVVENQGESPTDLLFNDPIILSAFGVCMLIFGFFIYG